MLMSTRTPTLRRRVTRRRALQAAAVAATPIAAAVVSRTIGDKRYTLERLVCRPDLGPPKVEVLRGPAVGNGYIFVGPKQGRGPAGPMILDRRGRVVWF